MRKRRRAGKWAGVRKKKGKSNGRDTDSTAGVMDGAERERGAGFIYKKMIICTITHSRNENS